MLYLLYEYKKHKHSIETFGQTRSAYRSYTWKNTIAKQIMINIRVTKIVILNTMTTERITSMPNSLRCVINQTANP